MLKVLMVLAVVALLLWVLRNVTRGKGASGGGESDEPARSSALWLGDSSRSDTSDCDAKRSDESSDSSGGDGGSSD